MNLITKKQLAAIRRAAFDGFKSQFTPEEFENLFGPGATAVFCFEILEPAETKTERWIVDFPSQINKESLKQAGFSENAKITRLFTVDRQTKQLY